MGRSPLSIESAVSHLHKMVGSRHYQEALIGILALAGVPQVTMISLRLDEFELGVLKVCPARLCAARARLNSHPLTSGWNLLKLIQNVVNRRGPLNGLVARDQYVFSAHTSRWLQLSYRKAQKSLGFSADDIITLRKLREVGDLALKSKIEPRDDLISACDTAAMLLKKRIPKEIEREDAVQDAALEILRVGGKLRRDDGYGQLPNLVASYAVRIFAKSKRNPVVLIPHYNWCAAEISNLEIATAGLKSVHASRLTKLSEKLLRSFAGRERAIVRSLFGLGKSGRPATTWTVAKRFKLSVPRVSEIEKEASRRAKTFNQRSSVFLIAETERSYRRSVAGKLDAQSRDLLRPGRRAPEPW